MVLEVSFRDGVFSDNQIRAGELFFVWLEAPRTRFVLGGRLMEEVAKPYGSAMGLMEEVAKPYGSAMGLLDESRFAGCHGGRTCAGRIPSCSAPCVSPSTPGLQLKPRLAAMSQHIGTMDSSAPSETTHSTAQDEGPHSFQPV